MKETAKFNSMQSALWQIINKKDMKLKKIKKLKDFKKNEVNFRIALWNPQANGVRYLKILIYNLCSLLEKRDWAKIVKIKNRNVGNPISIEYNGKAVCLDYLQAFYEMEFINKYIDINRSRFLEIGGGYGRTCHAIMSNANISEYYIVDLKNCLNLSKSYLRKVLDKAEFKKIKFVLTDEFDLLKNEYFDICLNIDSFAEMDSNVVRCYLDYINKHCKYLYVKNPVGKYYDAILDGHVRGDKVVKIALSMGILRDIIDIHDNSQIFKQAKKFVKVYKHGKEWKCIAESWAKPWSYYWQAIYKNKTDLEV